MKFLLIVLPFFFLNSCQFAPDAKASQENEIMPIDIFAQQFRWTIRYPGKDNLLGKTNYKLISETNPLGLDSSDQHAFDDVIVMDTFFLPEQKTILNFRSKDVLHAAYLPHFRMQLNVVPGMQTTFRMDNSDMIAKIKKNNHDSLPDFVLLCNKICGREHYNMKMNVQLVSASDFQNKINLYPVFIKH